MKIDEDEVRLHCRRLFPTIQGLLQASIEDLAQLCVGLGIGSADTDDREVAEAHLQIILQIALDAVFEHVGEEAMLGKVEHHVESVRLVELRINRGGC